MTELSVVVIAQDEESNLDRCLSSVAGIADEIVVVDGGSRDNTLKIARRHTDRTFVNPFPGHIQQKNFGLQKARGAWVLSLDADECLSLELRSSLTALFPKWADNSDGFLVSRRNLFLGHWMRHGGWYPDRKLRLVRKDRVFWGGTNPHDRLIPADGARLRVLPGDLLHFTSPDLETHLKKQRNHSRTMAEERFRRGDRTSHPDFWFHPVLAFLRSYVWLQGFRDGGPGFVLAALCSLYRLQIAVGLWERNAQREGSEILETAVQRVAK